MSCVNVATSNGAPPALAWREHDGWRMSSTAGSAPAGQDTSGCAEYEAQEPGDEGEPDIKRPPDSDIPEFDSDRPEAPTGPGTPPFTGEDVEDVGRPHKRDPPTVM